MSSRHLALGIDLGTSGVKLAIINSFEDCIYKASLDYPNGIEQFDDWKFCCKKLILNIPTKYKEDLLSCSIDGTSGTLLACNTKGEAYGEAIPYYVSFKEHREKIFQEFINNNEYLTSFESLERAFHLFKYKSEDLLLRHQADWITGWLLNNWEWGEESNNIKLGWDINQKCWPESFKKQKWFRCLPNIISSGQYLGNISKELADLLSLPDNLKIFTGTTDSNAAVLAINPSDNDGITVLGSTIVIKKFHIKPILRAGISNHYLLDKWICGGASNAGCGVFKKFFNNEELNELSKQINPFKKSGLHYIPLPRIGERFPIEDPNLKPILEPRPISDSLFLHGILEGLARIEALGWKKLSELGVKTPQKIITIGGGAQNQQWRRIREQFIGIPIRTSKSQPAIGTAKIAIRAIKNKNVKKR